MSVLEDLRWKKFPVLDQGYCTIVDCMGDDASVVQAARVSYGQGTKQVSDDRGLIRYLYRHGHGTPFEMAEIKLLVRVPMDCWRQWIRHRTANVNEYSTRYSEAIDANQQTPPDQWRNQSGGNKQGSDKLISLEGGSSFDDLGGKVLSAEERDFQQHARRIYERRIKAGVAREQARKDLPLSTYTEAYWKCDLRNVLGFLSLRMDSHAQQEIREYATVIGEEIVSKLFPLCWEAFNDFDQRRGGLLLSRLDAVAIGVAAGFIAPEGSDFNVLLKEAICNAIDWPVEGRCRERDECWGKLKRLKLLE